MANHVLHPPLPNHSGPHQSGITDPIWPTRVPKGEDAQAYKTHYVGQVERQRHLHIVHADVAVASRAELANLLAALTRFARHQMDKPPTQAGWRPFRSADSQPPGQHHDRIRRDIVHLRAG